MPNYGTNYCTTEDVVNAIHVDKADATLSLKDMKETIDELIKKYGEDAKVTINTGFLDKKDEMNRPMNIEYIRVLVIENNKNGAIHGTSVFAD